MPPCLIFGSLPIDSSILAGILIHLMHLEIHFSNKRNLAVEGLLVERRGGGGIPSVNLMEELLGSLIPPRSSMSLLGAGLSSSMLRGDSETECLREELADASDVDERVLLLPAMNFMRPLMVTPCCTHSKTNTPGVSCRRKNNISKSGTN